MSPRSVVLAVLLFAPASLAQLSEKQAVAQVKASSKEQLSNFKSLGKAALASLDADLKVIEATLDDTTTVSTFGNGVSTAAFSFLDTLNEGWSGALQGLALDTSTALSLLANGGDLEGLYPESLYAGSGGVLDVHRKAQARAATKLRDAAVKRLAKCAALAEKHGGLALTVRLELPVIAEGKSVNPGEIKSLQQDAGLDVVIGVSALDTADDGLLVIAGVCNSLDEVQVAWFRTNIEDDSALVVPTLPHGRFSATFSGLKEGAYVAVAVQQGIIEALGEIGVR